MEEKIPEPEPTPTPEEVKVQALREEIGREVASLGMRLERAEQSAVEAHRGWLDADARATAGDAAWAAVHRMRQRYWLR